MVVLLMMVVLLGEPLERSSLRVLLSVFMHSGARDRFKWLIEVDDCRSIRDAAEEESYQVC